MTCTHYTRTTYPCCLRDHHETACSGDKTRCAFTLPQEDEKEVYRERMEREEGWDGSRHDLDVLRGGL
jgi:hypothetical protein